MFWDQGPYNETEHERECLAMFNVTARRDWAVLQYGGFAGADAASNIIFSNGALDPWIVGALRARDCALKPCNAVLQGQGGEASCHDRT